MKQRPILFNAAMVRALLDGSKTQTRRIVKLSGNDGVQADHSPWRYLATDSQTENQHNREGVHYWQHAFDISRIILAKCPYGQPGDQLWVRETWAEVGTMDPGLFVYRANYPDCVPHGYENIPPVDAIKWKPSIHMIRKASRITLEIVSVRVERLQDISEGDARAEGVTPTADPTYFSIEGNYLGLNARESYANLWDAINGAGSCDVNPYVWVIEFKRVPA